MPRGRKGYKREWEGWDRVIVAHDRPEGAGWQEREIGTGYRERNINIMLIICYSHVVWLYVSPEGPPNPRVWSMSVGDYNASHFTNLATVRQDAEFMQKNPMPGLKESGQRATKKVAEKALKSTLEELFPGGWEMNGTQHAFKGSACGDTIAGYVSKESPEEKEQHEKEFEAKMEARQEEREETGCSLYGVGGDRGIVEDAYILIRLVKDKEELNDRGNDLWNRFVEAGGGDGHPGASWYGVRASAYNILAGYPPMAGLF